jgi:H/ACA ribonucleoprotein complex subunit 4
MPKTSPPWETKREHIVKTMDHTNPKYGSQPYNRPAKEYIQYGVINLNKPAGPTSHEVAAWTKKNPAPNQHRARRNLRPQSHGGCPLHWRIQQKSFKPSCTVAKNTFVL